MRTKNPRDVVTVFIPEYVVGHWWEQLLHNQSALRLKGRLLFQPGVMVTSVPWQLVRPSASGPRDRAAPATTGRRGVAVAPRRVTTAGRPARRGRPSGTPRPDDEP